jgi:hypothetical protein
MLGVDDPERAGSRPAGRPRGRMRDGESHFPGMSPECAIERSGERLQIDWLDQVSVEASLPRPHYIGVAAEGGHGDGSQLTKSVLRPETFQNGDAIRARHPKIQQKQVGRVRIQPREGFDPSGGRMDRRSEPRHHLPQHIARVGIVVDDEDGDALKMLLAHQLALLDDYQARAVGGK